MKTVHLCKLDHKTTIFPFKPYHQVVLFKDPQVVHCITVLLSLYKNSPTKKQSEKYLQTLAAVYGKMN
jgi:hypothetical protein